MARFKPGVSLSVKDADGLTSLAAANNLFLISATEGDLEGPAWGLSFPTAGVWKRNA